MPNFSEVYFPKGNWVDFFSGRKIQGPRVEKIHSDLKTFPLFVKAGTPIVMQPYSDRPATAPLAKVLIRTYVGSEGDSGQSTLYEDDGVTENYLVGQFSETNIQFRQDHNSYELMIGVPEGTYPGAVNQRGFGIEFYNAKQPRKVTVSGKETSYSYGNGVVRIEIPEASRLMGYRIRVQF